MFTLDVTFPVKRYDMIYEIHIKNMVCNRCIEAVGDVLKDLDVEFRTIQLGKVILPAPLTEDLKAELKKALQNRGFELLESQSSKTVEQIKTNIIQVVADHSTLENRTISRFLEQTIGRDYSFLSQLYSSVEGITIERYYILQRIEKVKELLIYNELNLSQIAVELGFSSTQHLSNQFKKTTGMSPTSFKQLSNPERNPLDQLGD
jgi:AraC-like DNA-binding protein